jgi:hypothetical protein
MRKIAITAGEVPVEQLLGHLVILVHHRFDMPIPEMDALMDKVNFPKEFRPNKPNAKNAFQSACRKLHSTYPEREKFVDPGNMMELIFDIEYFIDILPNGSRQLSRKIQYVPETTEGMSKSTKKILDIYVDKTQKEPEKMAIFEYKKEKDEIEMTPLYSKNNPLFIDEMTKQKYEELKEIFKETGGSYTERYLKQSWIEMMYDLSAIPYCGSAGNIWFVPKEGKRYVDMFGELYRRIHEKQSTDFTWRVIPAVDNEAQRNYIKNDVEKELNKKYENYLENLGKRIESVRTQEDIDRLRESSAEGRQKLESELNNKLIKKYSKLLKTSLEVKKMNDVKIAKKKSSRMKKALEFIGGEL